MTRRKKRPAAKTSRRRRKKEISADDVDVALGVLGDQVKQLADLARQIRTHALREIEIDGAGLFERGIDEIDRYIDNVGKGIAQARREKHRANM